MSRHLAVGRQGEDLAAEYLAKQGYRLVERNVRTRYGEIDIILLDGEVVVFVEVKARSSEAFGPPSDAVGPEKMRRLSRAAQSFLAQKAWEDRLARFDVVSINFDGPNSRLEHIADAFDLVTG